MVGDVLLSESPLNGMPVLNERYVVLNLLGKGGFSEVWKAVDLRESMYVALKVHRLDPRLAGEAKERYIKHATREYAIHKVILVVFVVVVAFVDQGVLHAHLLLLLKFTVFGLLVLRCWRLVLSIVDLSCRVCLWLQRMSHPNVVRLIDVFEIDGNAFATVLEYCSGNDLDIMLKQQGTLSTSACVSVLAVFGWSDCGCDCLSRRGGRGKSDTVASGGGTRVLERLRRETRRGAVYFQSNCQCVGFQSYSTVCCDCHSRTRWLFTTI